MQNQNKAQIFGKLFADGAAIERLRDGALVIARQGKELSAAAIEYEGCRFEAAPLDPSLEPCLAARTAPFGSGAELIGDAEKKSSSS